MLEVQTAPVAAKKLMSPSDILDSGVLPIEDGALEEMDGPSDFLAQ